MIYIKPLPYKAIREQLKKTDVISIVDCLSCAQTSGFHEGRMRELVLRLRADGFHIKDGFSIPSGCSPKALSVRKDDERTVLLALCCSAGYYNLCRYFPECRVIICAEDVGLMTADSEKKEISVVLTDHAYRSSLNEKYPLFGDDSATFWR